MKFVQITLLCLLTSYHCDLAAEPQNNKERLFNSNETLQLTLEAPFHDIYRKRDKTLAYSAQLTYQQNGSTKKVPLKIALRGNFRLDKENCNNPPLRFLFDKTKTKNTPFAKLEKVKFVQPCKNKSRYKELVLREYLNYRLYNEITPHSYQVRLVDIHFVDTKRSTRVETYGFFIEPNKRLAKRIDKKQVKVHQISKQQVNKTDMARLNLFQYMIANRDYSALTSKSGECCHNVKIFQGKEDQTITPIPYDFDFSGLVNAPYAVPSVSNSIGSVRRRRYRGFCEENQELREQVDFLRTKQPQLELLIADLPDLKPKSREDTSAYLGKFFEIIGDAKKVEKQLVKYCR